MGKFSVLASLKHNSRLYFALCYVMKKWKPANINIRNTSLGTVYTRIATNEIPRAFLRISVVKTVVTCDPVQSISWGIGGRK
jgi:hypothetical protein